MSSSTPVRVKAQAKVGIYAEQNDVLFGGTDSFAAMIAEALAPSHQVEMVHHCKTLTKDQLAAFSETDLSRVGWRYVPEEGPWCGYFRNPVGRYRRARRRYADLSGPYDLFINIGHEAPPFCQAPRGALIVLFPLVKPSRPEGWSWEDNRFHPLLVPTAPWKAALRSAYYRWEWGRRLSTYQVKAAISEFARTWTRRWWGVETQVLYPPFRPCTVAAPLAKTNTILSVGRFATQLHRKRQDDLVTAFRQMEAHGLSGWDYSCVGGLNNSPEDRAFFEQVRALADGGRVQVLANLERARLKELYEQAKVFWHAAGYGTDAEANPQLMEHFGIVTVEAMAAGCVPVVINKGAQPEIVRHGENGFLWDTPEQLKEYTFRLVRDDGLRARMSEAAQARAADFGPGPFSQRLRELLAPLLPG